MANKFKVIEKAKEKAERKKEDRELLKIRTMLNENTSEVINKSRSLLKFSNELRRESVFDMISQLIEGMMLLGESIENANLITPNASKNLTEIIKLKNSLPKNDAGLNEKIRSIYTKIKSMNDKFEVSLRELFDTLEAMLNGLLLNTELTISYSSALDNCLNHKLLTIGEYNILKLLGRIRNLFIHNSTNYLLIKRLDTDMLLMFKACILESRDLLLKVMLRHRAQFMAFGAFLKLEIKQMHGLELRKTDIKISQELYKLMLEDLELENLPLLRELYDEDELEKVYKKDLRCHN